jgi:hypothetical protein
MRKHWDRQKFLDILGEHPEVESGDFFETEFPRKSLFIGNPPFGKNSSLAVRFFNHSASFDPVGICMIHPRTFMKPRFWGRLDSRYHLSSQYELPRNSFNFCGKPYDVPCVAQVWVPGQRVCLPETLELFRNELDPILIRRVGASAGKVVGAYTPSSTYKTGCSRESRLLLLENYDKIRRLASMTAGVRSITLLEIEDILLKRYEV